MSTMIQVTEPTMVLNEEVCKSNIDGGQSESSQCGIPATF